MIWTAEILIELIKLQSYCVATEATFACYDTSKLYYLSLYFIKVQVSRNCAIIADGCVLISLPATSLWYHFDQTKDWPL